MYLNELVDDFVFGTNHGFNLIVCKPLSYTYTSSWLWGWKELYKLQTQKSVYAMPDVIQILGIGTYTSSMSMV